MARLSPLLHRHREADALLSPYGPSDEGESGAVMVVQTFAEVDLEYAAIRKGAALLDLPIRATLEVTGADRVAFLNRMLTQELKALAPGEWKHAFWLSRKGRIDADLRVIALPDRVLLDTDIHAAARVLHGLNAYVIADDVIIADVTERTHRLALHGPGAAGALGEHAATLSPGRAALATIAGREVVLDRDDPAGEPGFGLLVATDDAAAVYDHLAAQPGVRPAGWAAFNVARIEAGTPIYYVDFGPDSLPHESGALASRVSFTKGCYLGQEIVARMQSLGHPRQRLVAIRLDDARSAVDDTGVTMPPQPVTGGAVFPAPATPAGEVVTPSQLTDPAPVGAVTSSAMGPMLSGSPVLFAMVKHAHAHAGARVLVEAEGELVPGVVRPTLTFWARSAPDPAPPTSASAGSGP